MNHSPPPGWTKARFGNLFTLQLGKMLNQRARETEPQFPYLGNKDVQWGRFEFSELRQMHFDDKEKEKFRLLPGDLLVCEGGAVGRTALWKGEFDCYYQKAIHRLRAKDPRVEPRFILHFMRFAAGTDLFSDLTSQSSIAHLTREKLARLQVSLPPLPEQHKIAAILSSVDDAIEKTQAVIDQVQVVKRGLMQKLLTRGLPGRHERFKQTEIGEIPEEWDVCPTAEMREVRLGRQRSPKFVGGPKPRPYLRVVNVFDDRLDLRDVKQMDFDAKELDVYRLLPGDVLLTEGDLKSPRNVGRSAVFRGEITDCGFQNTLIRFRPSGRIDSDFAHIAFCFREEPASSPK